MAVLHPVRLHEEAAGERLPWLLHGTSGTARHAQVLRSHQSGAPRRFKSLYCTLGRPMQCPGPTFQPNPELSLQPSTLTCSCMWSFCFFDFAVPVSCLTGTNDRNNTGRQGLVVWALIMSEVALPQCSLLQLQSDLLSARWRCLLLTFTRHVIL